MLIMRLFGLFRPNKQRNIYFIINIQDVKIADLLKIGFSKLMSFFVFRFHVYFKVSAEGKPFVLEAIKRNLFFATISYGLIPLSLQPDGVNI